MNKRIADLVSEGKTDRQIAKRLGLNTSEVYKIRTQVLGVANQKKECKNCGELKNRVCFSHKHDGTKYEDWCITCRHDEGIDIYKRNEPKAEEQVILLCYLCIRCGELFESPVWQPNNQHYHTCPHCRKINTSMEQVSIR
jgi:DNA-directed RNA polymerase subunit RPC12/RpoP